MTKKNPLSNGIPEAIHYDHALYHLATVDGAKAVLSEAFDSKLPESLLDVGCGTGTWMRAAMDLGVRNIFGIDGVEVRQELLHVEKAQIQCIDISKPFNLGRRFEVALCLEVGEHLAENASDNLISSIVNHSNSILFSAACPDQPGQHHINCQWPAYWQGRFNVQGFVCDESIRWQIWDNERIEPWYRQNIFWARREPEKAGREPRLKSVIHPVLLDEFARVKALDKVRANFASEIERGAMPVTWYVKTPPLAAAAKLRRLFRGKRGST